MISETKPADQQSSPPAASARPAEFQNDRINGREAVLSSRSSATFENRLDKDNGESFSPPEERPFDPAGLDLGAGDSHGLGRFPSKPMAHTIASCRGRATDVPTEDGVPSVPATPGQLAAKTARRFDGAASAPDLPAQSPEQLIDQYGRYYDSDVETSYHYMAAFINLDSGETGIGQAVLDSLRDVLGAKRVMVLCGEVFTNPASLRLLIKQQAVIYHSPGRSPRQRRGTVVAAGGDGTVSFIMTQLDLVRRELEAEFQPFLISSQQQVQLNSDNSVFSTSSVCDVTLHPYFTMPALAPLPLGTGNDYSNCVGFGCGFSPIAKGWCGLGALCKCSGDTDAQVAVALSDAAKAPCVSFDRWEASLVPLRVAQAAVLSESSQAAAEAAQRGAPSALALHSPLWNRSARPRSVADAVCNVDWAKVHASGQCVTHGLINYLSVGFDAYVVKKFDSARRAHPAVCSTRAQNKAVYGVMGIRGALKCKKLCNIIPMVCVPRPKLSRVGGGAVATSRMSSTRDFVALQLPSMTKALVLTNVNCYSAGTHPWNPQSGELYYRPVTIRNGKVRPSVRTTTSGAAGATLPIPTPRPVTINDGAFELQAMGGVLHYTSLGIGLSNSTKLVQTDEMFVFVLCTPNDLHFPSGQCSTYTKLYMKDKYESRIESDGGVRASLNVQIDGEPMPRIAESTIIHVRRQPGARVLIRCLSPSVVQ